MALGLDATLAEWALARWSRAECLQAWGFDLASEAGLSLAEACARHGQDATAVQAALEDSSTPCLEDEIAWREAPLEALVTHLLGAHHDYLKQQLPDLVQAWARLCQAAGPDAEPLWALGERFEAHVQAELRHLALEEQLLFPRCRELGQGRPLARPGDFAVAVARAEAEHAHGGQELASLRQGLAAWAAPEGLQEDHGRLLKALSALQAKALRHLALEQHLLFPRAMALAQLGAAA